MGVASYWEVGQASITPAGTEGSVCGKGQPVNFQAQGVGQGLQFELDVWKLNIAQSIDYLGDSDPFLLRGQEELGRSLT